MSIKRTIVGLPMTQSELDDIRARLRKAATGTWTVRRVPNLWRSNAGDGRTHPSVRGFRVPKRMYEIATEQVEADATFMAHARQDVSALLAEFDGTRAILHDVQMALRELMESGELDQRNLEQIVSRLSATSAPWATGWTPRKTAGPAPPSSDRDRGVTAGTSAPPG